MPGKKLDPKHRRTTMHDVAKEAGVSVATVSFALRDDHRIKESTREKVKAAAKKIDFRPNPHAAALSSREFRNANTAADIRIVILTAVYPNRRTRLYEGVRLLNRYCLERTSSLGYQCDHIDLSYEKNPSKLIHQLHAEGVQGIILGRMLTDIEDFSEALTPFSLIASGPETLQNNYFPVNRVTTNVVKSVEIAFEKAYQHGYRRIGFMLPKHYDGFSIEDDRRRIGAIHVMNQMYSDTTPIEPYFDNLHRPIAMEQWYNKHQPDCIIGFNSFAYETLRKLGLKIPENCGYISLILEPFDGYIESISGCIHPSKETCERSAEILDQQLRFNIKGYPDLIETIYIDPTWADGETLLQQ